MTESTKDQAEISSQTGNAAAEGKAPEAKQDAPQGTEKAASSPQGEITKAARKKRDTTPGGMLRETREFMGLTIQDVTDRLKFRPEFISNLENNCFDSRTASTQLVRSWLIAYAKFLGIDRVMILDAFEKYHDGEKSGKAEAEPQREEPEHTEKWKTVSLSRPNGRAEETKAPETDADEPSDSGDVDTETAGDDKGRVLKNIMMFLLILVVCICITLILRVQNQGREKASLDSAVQTRVSELTTEEKPAAPAPAGTVTNAPAESAAAAADTAVKPAPAASQGKAAEESTASAPRTAAPAESQENKASDSAAPAPEAQKPAKEEKAELSVPEENEQPSAAVSGKAEISVTFKGTCWIEIQDAAGKRLISNTYRSGKTVSVSSERLPLTVRIGMKSNFAEFTVNGKPVEISSKFTVGK